MKTFKTDSGLELILDDLKGKDYLPAAQRVLWFRKEHPFGLIETERISESEKHVTYRATVSAPLNSPYERDLRKLSNADKTLQIKNTTDYEKCETMAIGRALALAGYGTQFASDDLDEGEHISDSPQEPKKRETAFKGPVGGTAPTKPLPKTLPPHKEEKAQTPPPPPDQTFTIGKDIKGKKFSEKLADTSFLKWVNDTLAKEGDKAHKQLLEFHRFARAHGAYRI